MNIIIQLEGWCFRGIQHGQFQPQHFNLTGLQVWVNRCFVTGTHLTSDLEYIFITNTLGCRKHLWIIGIKDYLHQTFTVT